MLHEVRKASFECLEILFVEIGLRNPAMMLEGTHGGDYDTGIGPETCHATGDVTELLSTEIRAEAGFRDDVIAKLHRRLRRYDGIAAMGDVGEGPPMYQSWIVLERLHEVGVDRVFEQRCHGPFSPEVMGGHRLAIIGVGDDHAAEARFEVGKISRQTKDGHDLGGHGNVKAVLPRHAIRYAAEAIDYLAKLAVVHVHCALPDNAARINPELVSLLYMVV